MGVGGRGAQVTVLKSLRSRLSTGEHLFFLIARAWGRWLEETHWEIVSTNQCCLTRKLAALEEGGLLSPQSCKQGAM